jgi:hypothetical protein
MFFRSFHKPFSSAWRAFYWVLFVPIQRISKCQGSHSSQAGLRSDFNVQSIQAKVQVKFARLDYTIV